MSLYYDDQEIRVETELDSRGCIEYRALTTHLQHKNYKTPWRSSIDEVLQIIVKMIKSDNVLEAVEEDVKEYSYRDAFDLMSVTGKGMAPLHEVGVYVYTVSNSKLFRNGIITSSLLVQHQWDAIQSAKWVFVDVLQKEGSSPLPAQSKKRYSHVEAYILMIQKGFCMAPEHEEGKYYYTVKDDKMFRNGINIKCLLSQAELGVLNSSQWVVVKRGI